MCCGMWPSLSTNENLRLKKFSRTKSINVNVLMYSKTNQSSVTDRDETSWLGQIRRSAAESEPCLQRVERRLQSSFLLELWRFVLAAVLTELFQSTLRHLQRAVWRSVLQPRTSLLNPRQQLQQPHVLSQGRAGTHFKDDWWNSGFTPTKDG